ncbi:MAG: hypothetical protein HY828_01135 [Actinobacteria bacterium]|nr:hypothetical protein [Actinomycetota bacterium]
MNHFLLYHRHSSADCAASFAAWNGFASHLRGTSAMSTCAHNAHEIWWFVDAPDSAAALAQLPGYVAARTLALRVSPVVIP